MKDRTSCTKELLLSDLKYLTDSFQKNKELGNNQCTVFIVIVFAILAILGTLFAISVERNNLIIFLSVFLFVSGSLLAFGIVLFFHFLKRRAVAVEYKYEIDSIRERIKDNFDEDGVLSHYEPFHSPPGIKPRERFPGGNVLLVAILNSILTGAVSIILSVILLRAAGGTAGPDPAGLISALILPVVFSLAAGLLLQILYAKHRGNRLKEAYQHRGFTHAGAVVYRLKNNKPEFLLVTGKRNKSHWVLPRGHIEAGETAEAAVVREVKEETGLAGRIMAVIGYSRYLQKNETSVEEELVKIKFYLMEKIGGDERTAPEGREWRWCSFPNALALVSFPSYRTHLSIAYRRLDEIIDPY